MHKYKYVTSRTHILVTTLSFIYSHIHTHKKKCHLKLVECKSLNLERRREGEKQPYFTWKYGQHLEVNYALD